MVCRDSPLSSELRDSSGVHVGAKGMGLNCCWFRILTPWLFLARITGNVFP